MVGVHRRMVFGSVAELRECFQGTPLRLLLTTNHIERDHLTCRLHNSRLVRRSITYSKAQAPLQWQCDLEDLYYCLEHSSLCRELPEPIPTKSAGSPKKWQQRTPAILAGLTDHQWSLKELLRKSPNPARSTGLGPGHKARRISVLTPT